MQFLRGAKGRFLSRNFSTSSVVKRGSTSLLRRNIQGHFATRQYSGLDEKLNRKFDTPETILAKVAQTRGAQPSWAHVPLSTRKQILIEARALLKQNKKILTNIMNRELNKPKEQAEREIEDVLQRMRYYFETSESFFRDHIKRSSPETALGYTHEPLGTIAHLSTWCSPLVMATNVIVPALLTGNAVLHKPSEYALGTGQAFAALFHEAGVPKEILQVILGDQVTGKLLVDTSYDGLFLQGKTSTGTQIAQQVGHRLIPLHFELSGKSALYVCDDTELNDVITEIVDAAFFNGGQSCTSVQRVYLDGLLEEFEYYFPKAVENLIELPPDNYVTADFSPLAIPTLAESLQRAVADAKQKGGKILTGGELRGGYFQPTTITNANHSMLVMREELLGPIVGVTEVEGDPEAIALLNDSRAGLTTSVYSQSRDRAEKIMRQLNCGTVYWNTYDRVLPYLPWSGRKGSGLGVLGGDGKEGFRAFVKPKSIILCDPPLENQPRRTRLTQAPENYIREMYPMHGMTLEEWRQAFDETYRKKIYYDQLPAFATDSNRKIDE